MCSNDSYFLQLFRFISDLKNVVVPFIQDQLLVMKIPPINSTKKTKIGNVDYSLWDVVFSGLVIPAKGVSVDFKDATIVIQVYVALVIVANSFQNRYNC
jgi:hypothetical protein